MADGISNAFHTPHGMNCVWVSPELMNACANVVPREVSVVGDALGVQFTGQETPEEIGAKTAEAIRSLMHSVGLKSPKELGFDRTPLSIATRLPWRLIWACDSTAPSRQPPRS